MPFIGGTTLEKNDFVDYKPGINIIPVVVVETTVQPELDLSESNPLWYVNYKYTNEDKITRPYNIEVNAYNAEFCKIVVYNNHQLTVPMRLDNPNNNNSENNNNKIIKRDWVINRIRNKVIPLDVITTDSSFNEANVPTASTNDVDNYEKLFYKYETAVANNKQTLDKTLKFLPNEYTDQFIPEEINMDGDLFNSKELDICFGNNELSDGDSNYKKTELLYIKPNFKLETKYANE